MHPLVFRYMHVTDLLGLSQCTRELRAGVNDVIADRDDITMSTHACPTQCAADHWQRLKTLSVFKRLMIDGVVVINYERYALFPRTMPRLERLTLWFVDLPNPVDEHWKNLFDACPSLHTLHAAFQCTTEDREQVISMLAHGLPVLQECTLDMKPPVYKVHQQIVQAGQITAGKLERCALRGYELPCTIDAPCLRDAELRGSLACVLCPESVEALAWEWPECISHLARFTSLRNLSMTFDRDLGNALRLVSVHAPTRIETIHVTINVHSPNVWLECGALFASLHALRTVHIVVSVTPSWITHVVTSLAAPNIREVTVTSMNHSGYALKARELDAYLEARPAMRFTSKNTFVTND